MIYRYPKIRCSRQGVSFQWWHGWFNHGWHSLPVNYWGLWFKPRLRFFRRYS